MEKKSLKMAKHKILIIDDEPAIREMVAIALEMADFDVLEAEDAQTGHSLIVDRRPDLVLLDWMLPSVSGIELARRLKRDDTTAEIPIVMLTAKSEEDNKIQGLDGGADDYITKPFKMGVLVARIRAQLRQHEQSEDAVFNIGPYVFRPNARLLTEKEQGRKIRLTGKEASILKYLYRAGSKAVSRDTLLSEVWGYNTGVTTHTLETHIYRLRQKIEQDPSEAEILVTEPGGYHLVQ